MMTKIILSFFIALGAFAVAHAQQRPLATVVTLGSATDTLKNTDTIYHYTAVGNAYALANITFSVDKISGTVAGSAIVQGSNDNIHWFNIDTSVSLTNITTTQHALLVNPHSWGYYRVRYYSSGTMAALPKTQIFFIKP